MSKSNRNQQLCKIWCRRSPSSPTQARPEATPSNEDEKHVFILLVSIPTSHLTVSDQHVLPYQLREMSPIWGQKIMCALWHITATRWPWTHNARMRAIIAKQTVQSVAHKACNCLSFSSGTALCSSPKLRHLARRFVLTGRLPRNVVFHDGGAVHHTLGRVHHFSCSQSPHSAALQEPPASPSPPQHRSGHGWNVDIGAPSAGNRSL